MSRIVFRHPPVDGAKSGVDQVLVGVPLRVLERPVALKSPEGMWFLAALPGKTVKGCRHVGTKAQPSPPDPCEHGSRACRGRGARERRRTPGRPDRREWPRRQGGAAPRSRRGAPSRPRSDVVTSELQVSDVGDVVVARPDEPLAGGITFGRCRKLVRNPDRHDDGGSHVREDRKLFDLAEDDQGRGVNNPSPRHSPARGRALQGWSGRRTP